MIKISEQAQQELKKLLEKSTEQCIRVFFQGFG